jgi:hypothetical protein
MKNDLLGPIEPAISPTVEVSESALPNIERDETEEYFASCEASL